MDPDLGWHLRYGQLILSSGLPQSDPFSYTMPSYIYANHEWLQDIILSTWQSWGGLELPSLIFAILTTSTIFLSIPKITVTWQFATIFLSAAIFLSFAGIRPQTVSWLFFVIVLKIIKSQRFFLLLPLIFLVWANLHGGFIIGLISLFIYVLSKTISERKILTKEVSVLILSILVTLINPYQFKLWQEIWKSATDPALRTVIEEWFPLLFAPQPLTIIWSLIFIYFFIKYKSGLSLFEKILYPILFLAAVSSGRNMPFFILATMPFSITFSQKYRKILIILFYLFLATFLLSVAQIFSPAKIDSVNYPAAAISFLKKQQIEGEIFAPYSWGGYLIWQYPQKKVFIDGRMPSWRQDFIKGESEYALGEYLDVLKNKYQLEEVFNKYKIGLVLWSISSREKYTEEFTKNLPRSGWKKIYEDEVAVIYER